ncbi:(Fe-S)-binding protein [Fodinisporobacter ferrooxydans]|uniref:Glycolate oxidase iron-sulfur subunit n=1 Tax=Fodinisporobacter ferrooxydans TaxID=2901836 RepID=A0ABY4CS36_9BACL|nr:(Fe-S)-binding protein [Alicyclobacillaceae bacterium MYW30-H2]
MDEIMNCMRCGYCLPACPTYRETGKESASPRGRIALMKAVADGMLPVDEEFDHNMYLCLGCRACETACPSGVKYGRLVETARDIIEETIPRSGKVRLAREIPMKWLFPHPKRMRVIGNLLWFYQKSGLQSFMRKSGLLKHFGPMGQMEATLSTFASPKERNSRLKKMIATSPIIDFPSRQEAVAAAVPALVESHEHQPGTRPLRVGLFVGCVMDTVFWHTNQATARVLAAAGCEVIFFSEQTCCGALHAHAGNKADALTLAKQNIQAFEKAGIDVMVNNAGGCGAALKEYDHWFHGDPEWEPRAKRFVEASKDISEILVSLQLPALQSLDAIVTFQDSCHLRHGQKIFNQPRQLLRSIPGITYVELPEADRCCGSAGIYNITNEAMSMQILDKKMQHVRGTKAKYVVTANPGCLLQMRLGIQRAGLQDEMEAIHIVDLIEQALPNLNFVESH